jgi:hypothetical protein
MSSDDTAKHVIGTTDCGCGWHPSCVGLTERKETPRS